jgi:hypothetical protein
MTIRRIPPPKMHEALPTDIVKLTDKLNDDFRNGGSYEVQNVNPRNPNMLQIKDKYGNTTFVPYFKTNLYQKIADREGMPGQPARADNPVANGYLQWP